MGKMVNCKTCGTEIAKSAKICPSCGAKNKRVSVAGIIIVVIVFIIVIAVGSSGSGSESDSTTTNTTTSENETVQSNSQVSNKSEKFEGDCGIAATAEMGSSVLDLPELTISIENISDRDISAIKFYVVPYDVYGEEITGLFAENYFSTDDAIGVGKATSVQCVFYNSDVKTAKLYVYSVYFADGTEWGDKEATKSTILKNGAIIEVAGNS